MAHCCLSVIAFMDAECLALIPAFISEPHRATVVSAVIVAVLNSMSDLNVILTVSDVHGAISCIMMVCVWCIMNE